jgi:hypothetical protein
MINGYKLIKDPEPIEIKDPIPLISWGELIQTSNILEDKKKKFTIPDTSVRENIARDLVNKVNLNNQNTMRPPADKV